MQGLGELELAACQGNALYLGQQESQFEPQVFPWHVHWYLKEEGILQFTLLNGEGKRKFRLQIFDGVRSLHFKYSNT